MDGQMGGWIDGLGRREESKMAASILTNMVSKQTLNYAPRDPFRLFLACLSWFLNMCKVPRSDSTRNPTRVLSNPQPPRPVTSVLW
jgi:hypothetical protein